VSEAGLERFKYRLQPVLDMKLERKEQRELELGGCVSELAAEQKALEELRIAQARMEERLAEAQRIPVGVSGADIRQYFDYLRGLKADVEAAREAEFSQRLRVRDFEEKVSQARQLLTDSLREVEILNKHRDRLEKRFRNDAEKKEAADHDEIGNMIFSRREAHS
jgi:flagellar export protein FliJ